MRAILLFFFSFSLTLQAQQTVKETARRYVKGDTILVHQKERRTDASGRLLYKKEYYYTMHQNMNSLWKEETALFIEKDSTLTQTKTYYKVDAEPTSEKLLMKYLRYDANDDSTLLLQAQQLDASGEPLKEDFFTYNKKGQLAQKCAYVYTGSTSLVCDVYDYNGKGLVKRNRSYTKWNTVGMRGLAKEKKTLRADYRYKYNRSGQLTRGKGKFFKRRYLEVCKYAPNGTKIYHLSSFTREEKLSKETREKNKIKAKSQTLVDSHRWTYNERGFLLEDQAIEANNSRRWQINEYTADTLLRSVTIKSKKDVVVERQTFERDPATGVLRSKLTEKYGDDGNFRYLVQAECDAKGNIIRETQLLGERKAKASSTIYEYDAQNRLLKQQIFGNTKAAEEGKEQLIEEIIFSYE